MNTVLKIALLAAGAYLLLSKLGLSLPALSGEPAPASPPANPGAVTSPTAIMLLVKDAALRDYPERNGLFTFWEWRWYYNKVIGIPDALPGPGEYGLPGGEDLVPITFDAFRGILRAAVQNGVGAGLPGILSGVRRSH